MTTPTTLPQPQPSSQTSSSAARRSPNEVPCWDSPRSRTLLSQCSTSCLDLDKRWDYIPYFGRYYYFFLPLTVIIDFYICYFWLFKRWFHLSFSEHFIHPNSNQPIRIWDDVVSESVCDSILLEMQTSIREKIIREYWIFYLNFFFIFFSASFSFSPFIIFLIIFFFFSYFFLLYLRNSWCNDFAVEKCHVVTSAHWLDGFVRCVGRKKSYYPRERQALHKNLSIHIIKNCVHIH